MSTKNKQFRQGDVFLDQVESIPPGLKPKKGNVLLAHGAATGHSHEISGKDAVGFMDGEHVMAVEVKKATLLRHQEHRSIRLPKGFYLVRRQTEYSQEAMRIVVD